MTSANAYVALPGGARYLVAHEVAHAVKLMQDYNKAKWDEYVAGPGAGLTYEQQVQAYPNSTQFAENEARANTVGQGILAAYGADPIGFTPTNGYQVC